MTGTTVVLSSNVASKIRLGGCAIWGLRMYVFAPRGPAPLYAARPAERCCRPAREKKM